MPHSSLLEFFSDAFLPHPLRTCPKQPILSIIHSPQSWSQSKVHKRQDWPVFAFCVLATVMACVTILVSWHSKWFELLTQGSTPYRKVERSFTKDLTPQPLPRGECRKTAAEFSHCRNTYSIWFRNEELGADLQTRKTLISP